MPGLTLAAINPDNTPHGYNLTFAFPMVLFIVIAILLYLLFSRPHRRVPRRPVSSAASSAAPAPEVAEAASVAGGLSLAPGGGTTESHHEPAGAHLVASVNPDDLASPAAEHPADTAQSASADSTEDTTEDTTGASE